MRTAAVLLTLCGLAALAGRADDPEPPGGAAELKKLTGTWKVNRMVAGPRELKSSAVITFTFDGDRLTRTTTAPKPKGKANVKAERSVKYKVKIDTKKKPHTIELLPEDGKNGPVGIYKIEKGELFLALGLPSGPKGKLVRVPPKDFKGERGPVYVMTREKQGK